jgi:oligopeptide transport system substrate-binding protein
MRKIQKMCAALLAGVMTVGTFAPSVFADEAAKELTDEQVINVRTTAFGNNYDVQDMGWRWMMAACYEGLYRDVADENGDEFILAGAESVDISDDGTVYNLSFKRGCKVV